MCRRAVVVTPLTALLSEPGDGTAEEDDGGEPKRSIGEKSGERGQAFTRIQAIN